MNILNGLNLLYEKTAIFLKINADTAKKEMT